LEMIVRDDLATGLWKPPKSGKNHRLRTTDPAW
jgi:hypothetical protein